MEREIENLLSALEKNLNEIYEQTHLMAKKLEEIGNWIAEHDEQHQN